MLVVDLCAYVFGEGVCETVHVHDLVTWRLACVLLIQHGLLKLPEHQ